MAAIAPKGSKDLNSEVSRLRDQVDQVTRAAHEISRISAQVAEGAKAQISSLDQVTNSASQMAGAMTETAGRVDTVATSSEELIF